jgi:hypothetical protein
MLRRVTFEEWQAIITIAAFFLFFTIFLILSIRAWRMRKSEREHMSNLPLEADDSQPNDK